jgi:hypothetical protein
VPSIPTVSAGFAMTGMAPVQSKATSTVKPVIPPALRGRQRSSRDPRRQPTVEPVIPPASRVRARDGGSGRLGQAAPASRMSRSRVPHGSFVTTPPSSIGRVGNPASFRLPPAAAAATAAATASGVGSTVSHLRRRPRPRRAAGPGGWPRSSAPGGSGCPQPKGRGRPGNSRPPGPAPGCGAEGLGLAQVAHVRVQVADRGAGGDPSSMPMPRRVGPLQLDTPVKCRWGSRSMPMPAHPGGGC